jgi:hypothetical protein
MTPPTPDPDVTATSAEDAEPTGEPRRSPELEKLGPLTPSWPVTGRHGIGRNRCVGPAERVEAKAHHTARIASPAVRPSSEILSTKTVIRHLLVERPVVCRCGGQSIREVALEDFAVIRAMVVSGGQVGVPVITGDTVEEVVPVQACCIPDLDTADEFRVSDLSRSGCQVAPSLPCHLGLARDATDTSNHFIELLFAQRVLAPRAS